MQKKIGIYLFEICTLIILLLSVSALYLSQKIISAYYNADMLYLPVLFQDLLYNGGNYVDWSLTPAPYFFPDWFVFFISFSLTKKLYFQFLINACLNVLLLYLAIRLIYQDFFSKIKTIFFSLASLNIFLFLAIKSNLQYSQGFIYKALFLPNIHVGIFIVGLFYIWIQLKLLGNHEINKCSYFIFFAVLISFAAGMSDPLYIVQFTLPVLIAYVLFYFKKKITLEKVLKYSLLPLIFSLIGVYLIKHIVHRSTLWTYLRASGFSFSLQSLKEDFTLYIFHFFKTTSPVIIVIFFTFYLSVILIFIFFIFAKSKKYKKPNLDINVIFLSCFFLFSVCINILATGLENSGVRYIYPFFYYPIVDLFYIGSIFKHKKIIINYISYFSSVVLLILLILLINFFFKSNIKFKKDNYPDDIRCLDKVLVNEGHNGVAEYWQSFNIMMLTKQKIKVFPLKRDLTPFSFIGNSQWYNKLYSFAIIDLSQGPGGLTWVLDERLIKKNNGEPKKTVLCGDKKILIYPKNTLKINRLSRSVHSFTWLANALFSNYPNSENGDRRIARATDTPNFLAYGPYALLPEGYYNFEINYISNASSDTKVAYWDIISQISGSIIEKTPIYGSENLTKTMKGKFYINKLRANKEGIEIRIFFLGGTEFIFESLTIEKV